MNAKLPVKHSRARGAHQPRMTALERLHLRNGILFCLPWIIGLSVFLVYPLLAALYYSLCDYSVLLPPVFIGLDNYIDLLRDALFWKGSGTRPSTPCGSVGLGVVTSLTLPSC